jgi:hypothetical protein
MLRFAQVNEARPCSSRGGRRREQSRTITAFAIAKSNVNRTPIDHPRQLALACTWVLSASDSRMKMEIVTGLLCAVLAGQPLAELPRIERPYWVIVATIIDRSTGALLEQSQVVGPGMRFDDLGQCQSFLDKIGSALTDRLAMVLTCEQVGPRELAV